MHTNIVGSVFFLVMVEECSKHSLYAASDNKGNISCEIKLFLHKSKQSKTGGIHLKQISEGIQLVIFVSILHQNQKVFGKQIDYKL